MAGYGLGTLIRATLARILIQCRDSDPHLRIRVRVLALKHGLFGLFTDFLRTFGTRFVTKKDMLGCVCGGGELLPSKSGLKLEKLSVRPRYFLDCAQVFYTSRGGIVGLIRPMARWGLQVNRHGTSFIKNNFNPRVCFAITFSHSCTGHHR